MNFVVLACSCACLLAGFVYSGNEHAFSYKGYKYLLVGTAQARKWADARKYCQERQMDLAVISDAEENAEVNEQIRNLFSEMDSEEFQFQWWIGLTDEIRENDWKTLCNQTPELTYWASGEPNQEGDEDCVHLMPFKEDRWNDEKCYDPKAFVCEERPCDEKTTTTITTTTATTPTTTTATTTTTTTAAPNTTAAATVTYTPSTTAPTPPPSTTERPTPSPTITVATTATPSTKKPDGCQNQYPDCTGLGTRVCTGLKSWAAEHCREFCGLCTGDCSDTVNCSSYGDTICSAARLSNWVDKNCRKFCNRC